MVNEAGKPTPEFQRGQKLRADDLNDIVGQVLKRMVGSSPLHVQTASGAVALSDSSEARRGFPDRQIAKIGSHIASGEYNWTRESSGSAPLGSGPETGKAKEVSALTTVSSGTKVVIFKHGGEWWFQFASSAPEIAPGKILSKVANFKFQVDIYKNGFTQTATESGKEAQVVDETSLDFSVNEQITVFKLGSLYWIATTRSFGSNDIAPIRFGDVVSHLGSGLYKLNIREYPGASAVQYQTNATEMNGSTLVTAGMKVPVFYVPTQGTSWFWAPLGDCT